MQPRNIPTTVLVTREIDDKLRELAEQEFRTVSATAALLIAEALKRREQSLSGDNRVRAN